MEHVRLLSRWGQRQQRSYTPFGGQARALSSFAQTRVAGRSIQPITVFGVGLSIVTGGFAVGLVLNGSSFGPAWAVVVLGALSILAEPPVAVVDKVADKKGTRAVAEAYLKYWYTKEGQEIAARNSYRPRDSEIAKEYEKSFAKVELFTIDDVFGGWTKAQKDHFGEGGIFDQIYKN